MAKLIPYNINIKKRIYCADEKEARNVQQAIQNVADGAAVVIGEDVLKFSGVYSRNKGVIDPIINDVMKNGPMSLGRHIMTLRKIK